MSKGSPLLNTNAWFQALHLPQHRLYFLPLPQEQGSLRPVLLTRIGSVDVGRHESTSGSPHLCSGRPLGRDPCRKRWYICSKSPGFPGSRVRSSSATGSLASRFMSRYFSDGDKKLDYDIRYCLRSHPPTLIVTQRCLAPTPHPTGDHGKESPGSPHRALPPGSAPAPPVCQAIEKTESISLGSEA